MSTWNLLVQHRVNNAGTDCIGCLVTKTYMFAISANIYILLSISLL